MVGNYKVVTLCGSTRFKDDFMRVQKELTLQAKRIGLADKKILSIANSCASTC